MMQIKLRDPAVGSLSLDVFALQPSVSCPRERSAVENGAVGEAAT